MAKSKTRTKTIGKGVKRAKNAYTVLLLSLCIFCVIYTFFSSFDPSFSCFTQFRAVHTVWILINFVTHILWVPNGTKHNVTYLPLSPFHIFTDLSNAALAIRRPSGEKLTWFIKAWWPVIRAKGFLLSSGSHRKRVKSSEPDTNRSPLPPCTTLNKSRLSWWSTITLFALSLEEELKLSQWTVSEVFPVYRKILKID